MKRHLSIMLFAAAMIFELGCSSITEEELPLADVQRDGDTIFIVDQTGKKWTQNPNRSFVYSAGVARVAAYARVR